MVVLLTSVTDRSQRAATVESAEVMPQEYMLWRREVAKCGKAVMMRNKLQKLNTKPLNMCSAPFSLGYFCLQVDIVSFNSHTQHHHH